MSLLNPLNITGPTSSGNFQQPNTANPAPNAAVASYPIGSNVLNLTWPIAPYVQPNNPTSVTPAFPLGPEPD